MESVYLVNRLESAFNIWISYPLTELVTLGFAVFFLKRSWQNDLVGLVPAA